MKKVLTFRNSCLSLSMVVLCTWPILGCDKDGSEQTESSSAAGSISLSSYGANVGQLQLEIDVPDNYELERLDTDGEPEATILKWFGEDGEPEFRVGVCGANPVTRDAPTTLAAAVAHVERGPVGERVIAEQTESETNFVVIGTAGNWTHLSVWLRGEQPLRCWMEYRSTDLDDPRLELGRRVCGSLAIE